MSITPSKTKSGTQKCPVCGHAALAATFKPFCSERCTNVDLHRWLTGGYVVASDDGPPDDELSEERDKS